MHGYRCAFVLACEGMALLVAGCAGAAGGEGAGAAPVVALADSSTPSPNMAVTPGDAAASGAPVAPSPAPSLASSSSAAPAIVGPAAVSDDSGSLPHVSVTTEIESPPPLKMPGPGQAPWAVVPTLPLANPERVLQGSATPYWKRCYQKGRQADPTQAGQIVVILRVLPDGDVTSANVEGKSGVSASLTACVLRGASHLTFDAPGNPGTVLRVKLTFALQ